VTLEHKHSDYKKFELYQRGVGKEEWKRDKIWVVSRVIVEKKLPGWQRLKFLLDKAKKAISSTKDHDGTKYTRDEDMFLRVLAVLAAIGCKSPLSIFDNKFMKMYTTALNSKHKTPYRLERNRIVEVILDYAMLEYSQILTERRQVLGDGFVSVSTDFWTDPHRKEQFASLMGDLTAYEYVVEGADEWYFMIKATVERLDKKVVSAIVSSHIHYYGH
jgi:hypothetical protein